MTFGVSIPKVGFEGYLAGNRSDYRFAPFNMLLLVVLMLIGLVIHTLIHGFDVAALVYAVVAAVVLGAVCAASAWPAVVLAGTAAALACYLILRSLPVPVPPRVLVAATVLSVLIAPTMQIANQWERGVLLRFGRFAGIRGPGVFFIVPVVDRVVQFVDQRIRVTDFRAETTLTKDTVPVNVDAIAFWMVWDAEKAVLEVADFEQAVILSAQTALRDAIGRSELAELLSHREKIGHEIQQVLDAKTNPWGITAQSVEIRDIIIPKNLEDAMSRQAQAERERQSRIILGTAETEIAEKFAKASEAYKNNPVALHLRAMNMVFEGLKQKGSMIIVPSSAVETMALGALGGLTAFGLQGPREASAQETSQPQTGAGEESEKSSSV